jgi:hypothetical protein
MAEHTETTSEIQSAHDGVLRSFITLGTNLTETTVGAAFGSVEDLRVNGLRRARGLIDWVESMQQANIDIARKLTDRVDTVTRAVLQTGEQALKTVVHTTRETTHGAVDTASRSAAAFISKPAARAPLS